MVKISSMKVSIIVPCYQVQDYIVRSIDSIIKQEFEDYEIIVVDDGTEDRSTEYALERLASFPTYKIIKKPNGGLPAARNSGLRAATGKYVCFIDSDDIISQNHLSSLYNLCESHNLLAAYSLYESTSETNRYGSPCEKSTPTILNRNELLHGFMDRRFRIHCCSLLINRSYLLEQSIWFNEGLRYGEDIDFMWRLFPTLHSIGCTNISTYKYLIRNNSLMTNQNVSRVETAIKELNYSIEENKKKYPNDIRIWEVLPARTYLSFCRSFARSSTYQVFRDFISNTNKFDILSLTLRYPNLKVRIWAGVYILSKKLFYKLSFKNY